MDMASRVAATDRVVARFRDRPFCWRSRGTCVHLARSQMIAMGHRPPSVPDFRSPRGALTALKRMGHETLEELLDAMLPRIAPAAAWPGDLILVPGEPPFDAIGIAAGGAVMMYHADADGLVPVKGALVHARGAWRL